MAKCEPECHNCTPENCDTYDKCTIKKLDLCKVWNVKVCDCYFDGQVSPHIVPIFWTEQQIRDFRKRVRKPFSKSGGGFWLSGKRRNKDE